MARLDWRGAQVRAKVAEAAALGIDKVTSDCVADARSGHPAYPPASEPGERYANRTNFDIAEIKAAPAALEPEGEKVKGTWGSDSDVALFLEIGTSVEGATATQREDAADGDMDEIAPPQGPLMAARPTLRPAADRHYPTLGANIGRAYREEPL